MNLFIAMALTSFGTRPQHRPTATLAERRARMHALLMEDDWQGWSREFSGNDKEITRWMRTNIVQAMQSCPTVFAYWKSSLPKPFVTQMVMHCISGALDGIGDDARLHVLKGEGTGKLERMIHGFVTDSARNWAWLSPSWCGAPNTELRACAQNHGWTPAKLPAQVTKALEHPSVPTWTDWIVYPHALLVSHRQMQVQLQERQSMAVQAIKRTSASWGNPIDIALARQLIAQSPQPLLMELATHRDIAPLPESEHLRLQGLVQVHKELGLWNQLQASLLAGVLPGEGMQASMALELPDLGDLTLA